MVVAAGWAIPSRPPSRQKTSHKWLLFCPMVVAAGFEPAIAWMKTMCPRPLDDATTCIYYSKNRQKVQA